MILYLGTSSLVMLYMEEQHTDTVRSWVRESEIVATCRIAYTEMISSLDKRFKNNDLSEECYNRIIKRFSEDWQHIATVDFDEREAGMFVKKYGLNRFAAIHLSAAKLIQRENKAAHIAFSSLDEELCKTAAAEGLNVLKV